MNTRSTPPRAGYPIDLHSHSTCSDGALTPEALVRRASEGGVKVLALTDHDTTSGVARATAAAEALGVRLVPGIEISAWHEREVHILGYFVRPDEPTLVQVVSDRKAQREDRVRAICARLRALGLPLDPERIIAQAGGNVGRPHVARAMVYAHYVKTLDEAFKRYLGARGSAYVPASRLPVSEAIDLIHGAGGVAVAAHPAADRLEGAIAHFAECGLDGVEVYHPAHSYGQRRALLKLCALHDLAVTGGTDFHGPDGDPPGTCGMEPAVFERLLSLRPQATSQAPAVS